MPPVRTAKKKASNNATTLSAFGLKPVDKDVALRRSARVAPSMRKVASAAEAAAPSLPSSSQPAVAEAGAESQDAIQTAAPAPAKPAAAPKLLKPVSDGEKEVNFQNNQDWDKDHRTVIGFKTRKLTLGGGFALTDKHIDDLIAMGPRVCASLWHLEFNYEDVSYGATNSARELTTEAVVRLARSCPKLRRLQLQDANKVDTNAALLALLENCPELTWLELSGRSDVSAATFEHLLGRPDLAVKLRTLRVQDPRHLDNTVKKEFMKTFRDFSRARDKLTIGFTSFEQYKKWGDWELESRCENYRKGRVSGTVYPKPHMDDFEYMRGGYGGRGGGWGSSSWGFGRW